MKNLFIIYFIALSPWLAFAECPNLSGTYSLNGGITQTIEQNGCTEINKIWQGERFYLLDGTQKELSYDWHVSATARDTDILFQSLTRYGVYQCSHSITHASDLQVMCSFTGNDGAVAWEETQRWIKQSN